MRIRFRYLLISLVLGGVFLIAFGCSQHDDVVQPQEMASITLRPQNLPNLDTALYVYELWMVSVDESTHDSTFTSLGRFVWDNYAYAFKDLDGNVIDSVYEVPEPWLSYDYIVLSVENRNGDASTPSGTYMMADEVVDPISRPIVMKFPANMFDVLGYYFVATPTDDMSDRTNEEKGLWICSRAPSQFNNHDTLGVNSTNLIVYPIADPEPEDSIRPDTVGIVWPVDSIWSVIDTIVVFGYDTLFHRRLNLEWIIDTVPEEDYLLEVDFEIKSACSSGQDCSHLGQFGYWNYTSPLEELPDVQPYGWRYNAWVLLEDQPSGENSGLNLDRMSPFGFEGQQNYSGDTNWTVLSLGAFYRPDSADLSNPHISFMEVPDYPGEDFIVDASPAYDNLDLELHIGDDATGGEFGSIVIGMEPIPSANMTIDENRNFPMVFMIDFLPYYEEGTGVVPALHNWSQFLPEIDVIVNVHE
ncbi:MAG: hypothetical protein GY841_02405 [FCB group bacterium]|nr:hypothetical protein [FCB group bacterium]